MGRSRWGEEEEEAEDGLGLGIKSGGKPVKERFDLCLHFSPTQMYTQSHSCL
jgi:hypothetical protein